MNVANEVACEIFSHIFYSVFAHFISVIFTGILAVQAISFIKKV